MPWLFAIIYMVAAVPSLIGAVFYAKFLKEDTKNTREGVVKGTLYNGVTLFATIVILLVQWLLFTPGAGFNFVTLIIYVANCLVAIVIMYYFVIVTKRFAE